MFFSSQKKFFFSEATLAHKLYLWGKLIKTRKMKIKLLGILFTSALIFSACSKKTTNVMIDGHNAQNALDWTGTYSGIEPCADCEGIKNILKLEFDGNYTLTTEYLGTETSLRNTETGKFIWKDGNTIQLKNNDPAGASPYYKIGESQIWHLDKDGNEVKGVLATYYILTKTGNPQVEDQKWGLTELYGEKVDGNPDNYYLIFNSNDGTISAKAGCNTLNFPYMIEEQFKLTTGEGISTMMACQDMEWEKKLSEAITKADNISVGNGTLTLNKARMAPLAVFKLIK